MTTNFVADLWEALGRKWNADNLRAFDLPVQDLAALSDTMAEQITSLEGELDDVRVTLEEIRSVLCQECAKKTDEIIAVGAEAI